MHAESSEESESSSSSEEDDGASVDSRDIGPIRLDPNVCPDGCEPDVFNKTYELRNTRLMSLTCLIETFLQVSNHESLLGIIKKNKPFFLPVGCKGLF